jgi:hypothetical protein
MLPNVIDENLQSWLVTQGGSQRREGRYLIISGHETRRSTNIARLANRFAVL